MNILAQNTIDQTRRCVESVLRYAGTSSFEIILVDNASQDGLDLWAESLHHKNPRVHLLRTTRKMGVAEARNIGLKRSRGRYILLLNSNVELTGDILTPLAETLESSEIGLQGCVVCVPMICATLKRARRPRLRQSIAPVWPSNARCSSNPVC